MRYGCDRVPGAGSTFVATNCRACITDLRLFHRFLRMTCACRRGSFGTGSIDGSGGVSPEVSFGTLLRKLRIDAGLTQEELAETAQLSYRSISDLERGINLTPRKETMRLLAAALHLAGAQREAFEAAARGHVRQDRQPTPGAVSGLAAATRTLPRDITSFTGRESELRRLIEAASEVVKTGGTVGIYAVGGMAGIGKTTFAVHAAHLLANRFPDGQIFLPLHGHTPGQQPVDPAEALASLLQTAGVAAQEVPHGLEARGRLWRDYLSSRRMLIVLDDATRSDQVRPLLPGTAGSLVLITSRRHLTALEDAHTVSLDTLPPAEAAELLVRLATRSDLRVSDAAVREITHLCGYLPLAIGIVARQLHHHPAWSAAGLASDLAGARDRLTFMHAENLSVNAAFDLTYKDLTADQQRMFSHLGLHPGTEIDNYTAAALDGSSLEQARHLLEDIYDYYLLTEPTHGRYRFHDLIREHARIRGEALSAGERSTAMRRLLDYYLHTVVGASHHHPRRTPTDALSLTTTPPTCSPDLTTRKDAVSWIVAERLNLHAAAIQAGKENLPHHVIGIAAAMHGFMRTRGHWDQAIALHSIALTAAREAGTRHGEAGALADLGDAQYLLTNYAMATESLGRALDLYREVNDQLGEAGALSTLGVIQNSTGKFEESAASHERSLNLYRKLGHTLGEATALNRQGGLLSALGDKQRAIASQEQALTLYRTVGHNSGEASALGTLGNLQLSIGDYPAAKVSLSRARELHHDLGNPTGEANALNSLGSVQLATRDYATAAASLDRALAMYRNLGSRLGEAWALAGIGTLHYRLENYADAAADLSHALAITQDLGRPLDQAQFLNNLGEVSLASAASSGALKYYEQALAISTSIGSLEEEARALEGIARCHLREGQYDKGTASLHKALAIYRQITSPDAERVEKLITEYSDKQHHVNNEREL
jgi:tetratricopeptide (TPR) repeat protein/transcriptional regulator with XRE-family HTH domain